MHLAHTQGLGSPLAVGVNEIVIVDPVCERYADVVLAAQAGEVGVHFCVDGRSALRLSRRFRADIWLVAADLHDLSGFDLLDALSPHVLQGNVDPLLGGSRVSLDRVGQSRRSRIFIVSDTYRLDDEQRALASGVAGYLVRPFPLDMLGVVQTPPLASYGVLSRGNAFDQ